MAYIWVISGKYTKQYYGDSEVSLFKRLPLFLFSDCSIDSVLLHSDYDGRSDKHAI
jgi:hypothetical protein